jgi:hypothetical protein
LGSGVLRRKREEYDKKSSNDGSGEVPAIHVNSFGTEVASFGLRLWRRGCTWAPIWRETA